MKENEKSDAALEGWGSDGHGLRQTDAFSGLASAVSIKGCPEERWLASAAIHVGLDVDSARVADVLASALREIEAVLRPVIGQVGFDALYLRGVCLAGLVHPWLTRESEPAQAPSGPPPAAIGVDDVASRGRGVSP
jgi:hypothetical protein